MGINLMIEYCLCNIIIASDAENWNLSSAEKSLDFLLSHQILFYWNVVIRPFFILSEYI